MSDGKSVYINPKTNSGGTEVQSSPQGGLLSSASVSPLKIKMSKQRYVNTRFWDDNYITSLEPKEKLLFLYFLTNPLTNIAGIYEISPRRINFDTGLEITEVNETIKKFSIDRKIYYIDGWVIICNFPKYQDFEKSPKIKEGIEIILNQLPQEVRNNIDTLSIPYLYPSNYSNTNINTNKHSKPHNVGVAISSIIDFFKELKGYKTIPDWDKHHFARHAKAAKKLQEVAPNDWKKAMEWQSKQAYSWTIETVIKKYPDYLKSVEKDDIKWGIE